ncbi:MgtC/SapB family protein [Patescibacteria group bacterium]|nr:MgtC/SapB family protein [Patescibacteria group bacterium]
MELLILQKLVIALGLSGLIGLDRERSKQKYEFDDLGGVRTFALVGLLGVLAYSVLSPALFAVVSGGFFALVIATYVVSSMKSGRTGATSEIAAVLVYLIGVLCGVEDFLLATVIALLVFLVLHFKQYLHTFASKVNNEELISTAEFIIIAGVVLPLLPNIGYGPYGVFNPYVIWLMVVFISGISFASYVAIKLVGPKKGIGLTGFLAGLISSTALTLSFSAQSKKNTHIVNPYAFAIIVASSAMFFRVILEVAVLNREMLALALIPMLTMGGVGLVAAFVLWFKKEGAKVSSQMQKEVLDIESPFSLLPALKFGAIFAGVLFLSKAMTVWFGDSGLYVTSVFSGLMDVDAITVSVANLANNGLAEKSAVYAITIATMTNTVVKGGIFLFLGSRVVGRKIVAIFTLMILAGGISLLFV